MSKFVQAPLPYADTALEPVISARTLSFHYGKHHKAYVDMLNTLVEGTPYADMALHDIVKASAGKDGKDKLIFNNAGQVWNHDFYWHSLSPKASTPSAALAKAIETYGGQAKLIADLADAGKTQFGSGWAWLVSKNGQLSIEKTANAESPMANGVNCLLTVDVWEHAYYLDFQNARPAYLEAVLTKLLNWDFASRNLDQESTPVRAVA